MFKWIKRVFTRQDTPTLQLIRERATSIYGPTLAGVNVNERNALTNSAVLACIRVYGETIASLPLPLYRRLERGRARDAAHPLYRLLHDAPNEYMTSFTFRETLEAHRQTWGNAYAAIIREPMSFRPVALYPLLPDRTEPVRINGQLFYRTHAGGEQHTLYPYEVLHIPGLGFDGVKGYSPIQLMRQGIGLAKAAEEFGARLFGQGLNMGGILKHPGTLSPTAYANLKSSMEDRYAGLENALKMMILEEGMGFERLGIPPEDAQFLQTRAFQVTDIARAWRLQPHKIGDLSRSTNNNIEHQGIEFVTDSIRPVCVRWEQEFNRKLLFESEQGEWYFEFNLDGLLRGDIESRYRAYSIARQWGWYSVNDIREKENENPIEGGDQYLAPMNMTPAGTPAAVTTPPAPPVVEAEPDMQPGPDVPPDLIATGFDIVIRDAVARIVRKEIKAFDRPNRADWWATHKGEHREFVGEIISPVVDAYCRLAGMKAGTRAIDFAGQYVEALDLAGFEPIQWQARTDRIVEDVSRLLRGEK